VAAYIVSQRVEHAVLQAVSCRALGVSQAWFYKWRCGDRSLRGKHRAVLAAQIDYLYAKHNGTYGSPRITADLRELGYRVSVNTVAKVMAEKDLVARCRYRRRSTTRSDRSARKAPDAVNRDFTPPERPDVIWCGDLTESRPARASSTSRASWICIHGGVWGSRWTPITTRNWPGRRCRWRSPCVVAR
jgi:putative transposase